VFPKWVQLIASSVCECTKIYHLIWLVALKSRYCNNLDSVHMLLNFLLQLVRSLVSGLTLLFWNPAHVCEGDSCVQWRSNKVRITCSVRGPIAVCGGKFCRQTLCGEEGPFWNPCTRARSNLATPLSVSSKSVASPTESNWCAATFVAYSPARNSPQFLPRSTVCRWIIEAYHTMAVCVIVKLVYCLLSLPRASCMV